jgi:hypothetical protein
MLKAKQHSNMILYHHMTLEFTKIFKVVVNIFVYIYSNHKIYFK